MLGWQLRHDPNVQLPVLRLPSIRQGRRLHVEQASQRRKLSHSTTTTTSAETTTTTSCDEERRKLLPERRKTLATSTIPKDLFLIAAAAAAAASSSTSSLAAGEEGFARGGAVGGGLDEEDDEEQQHDEDGSSSIPSAPQAYHYQRQHDHSHHHQHRVPPDYVPAARRRPVATAVVRRVSLVSGANVSGSSGGLASAVIVEEEDASGVNGDHCRTRAFDFSYADQCELEDLLERTATGGRPLSLTLADASAAIDGKDVSPGGGGIRGDKDATEMGTTLQELSESKVDEESSECDGSEGWKRQARLILPHVGLVLLTCAYTLIGASIFYVIEQPYERSVKQRSLQEIFATEDRLLSDMFRIARYDRGVSEAEWRNMSRDRLLNLTDILFESFDRHFLTSKEIRDNDTFEIWSFSTAVFFAATVVTTIGYGSPVPVTFPGRLVCVFFALFGIPLTLLTIANVGKFFSEHLLWLYGCYLRLTQKLQSLGARFRKGPHASNDKHHDKSTHDGPLICDKCRRPSGGGSTGRKPSLSDIDLMDIQEKTVPASAVLSILIGYTALGGFIFCNIENWDFFEAFYFSFITMTTIGFGDLVPRNSKIVLILLYIVLGLAITTMCIDLVGAHYVRKIHYFGRKIQDARSALAIVGGKVVYVGELYAQLMSKKYGLRPDQMDLIPDAFIIENLYLTKHLIPFIPRDIKRIRYIDAETDSFCSDTSSAGGGGDNHSCRYCHGRMSTVSTTQTTYLKPHTSSVGRSPRYNRV